MTHHGIEEAAAGRFALQSGRQSAGRGVVIVPLNVPAVTNVIPLATRSTMNDPRAPARAGTAGGLLNSLSDPAQNGGRTYHRLHARAEKRPPMGSSDRLEGISVLGISSVTVMREWRGAKAWLYRELNAGAVDGR